MFWKVVVYKKNIQNSSMLNAYAKKGWTSLKTFLPSSLANLNYFAEWPIFLNFGDYKLHFKQVSFVRTGNN